MWLAVDVSSGNGGDVSGRGEVGRDVAAEGKDCVAGARRRRRSEAE